MKQYNTEIISVGTELLLGHITNTDTRDVAEMISRIGINVRYKTSVSISKMQEAAAKLWLLPA